jgi:8-oxo-dGTP pyrophosphatase MutT (NUDIX family)
MERVVLEAPDWINVVALTEDRNVVLVRQFRFGRRSVTLEIPGGMVDPGEAPEAAARRELLEETGYGGGRWRLLGAVEPNPAMLDNLCFHFLAEDVRPVAAVAPDGGEDIAISLLPVTSLPALVRDGGIRHSLVISALSRVIDLRAAELD